MDAMLLLNWSTVLALALVTAPSAQSVPASVSQSYLRWALKDMYLSQLLKDLKILLKDSVVLVTLILRYWCSDLASQHLADRLFHFCFSVSSLDEGLSLFHVLPTPAWILPVCQTQFNPTSP